MQSDNGEICSIAVPVYKAVPNSDELASLRQLSAVLGDYAAVLVAPDSLPVDAYLGVAPALSVERFSRGYFENRGSYNRLMLSTLFYERFQRWPYVLIYQLDAWVFRDELPDWCSRGYAYIGAPWYGGEYLDYVYRRSKRMAIAMVLRNRWRHIVGNGGFSLRHIQSCLDALTAHHESAKGWDLNEDGFWSLYAMNKSRRFKVPRWKEAAAFAFEVAPAALARATGIRVPFGCHAWQKHDPEYWQGLIHQPRNLDGRVPA